LFRKVILTLSVLFVLFMTGLLIYFLMKHDTSRWQVALGGIIISALPIILLFVKRNPFNIPIILGYYLFIFCSTFLGSICKFYLKHKWWDTTLHVYKGLYVGIVAIALYKLFVPENVRKDVSRSIVFLFVLSLAVTSSILWEIYEYLGDVFYTDTMQLGGNKDTMYDLLGGIGGGIVVAVYASVNKLKL
jgi:hypothetical protein